MSHNCPALRLLIVEDDLDTRANLSDILLLDDHSAQFAGSVEEALAPRDWRCIDAVLLDRKLPDGTADDVLPQLRLRAPGVAIVIVTGFADVESAISALRRGAHDYLLKPINPEALRAGLRRIAEQLSAERELAAQARRQSIVTALGRSALASHDLKELAREVAARVHQALGPASISIRKLSPDGRSFSVEAAQGGPIATPSISTDVLLQAMRSPRLVMATSDGLRSEEAPATAHVVANRAERKSNGEAIATTEASLPAAACVRIEGRPRSWGVLVVATSPPREWSESERLFLESTANVFAAAADRVASEDYARQQDRLAAIGQMVAGLAHESRNALQRSQACLETLALELDDRPQALELVDKIQRAQDHLHHLYEEVRAYAAPIHVARESCELRSVWREVWSHLAARHREKRLELSDDDSPWTVRADRHALAQLFRNLLENAIDASPQAGKVSIRCREAAWNDEFAVELWIDDEGPGVPTEMLSQIFDPFFTTKTHGTGLGMAIARRIVEAHGGAIAAQSAPRGGARFVVALPTMTSPEDLRR